MKPSVWQNSYAGLLLDHTGHVKRVMECKFKTLLIEPYSLALFWIVAAVGAGLTPANTIAEQPLPSVATEGTPGFVAADLVYPLEGRPTPECHAATIVESNGKLVAAWFAGTEERDPDVGIWMATKGTTDRNWSQPRKIVNGSEGEDQEFACWNPVLFQPKEGPLLLFYKVGPTPRTWWGVLVTSVDGGQTWSTPRRLGTNAKLPKSNQNLLGPVKNKPILLPNGWLLCGSSTENDGWKVHFELTKDLGQTWEVIGPIHDASRFNAIQPTLLSHPDGKLQVLCRTQEQVLSQSWSNDSGLSWTNMTASKLPNPSSGVDAVSLVDGRHLLVYNPTVKRAGDDGRGQLCVALSGDGNRWTPVVTLENQAGEYSYPAVIQTKNRQVHILYTWQRKGIRHVVLDPNGWD